jgi:hypothetical protein
MKQVSADFQRAVFGTWDWHAGELWLITECRELEAGHWEGFISIERFKDE